MTRSWPWLLCASALALFGAGPLPPRLFADGTSPAHRFPYLIREVPDMDQPSSFWLMPDPQRTATRVLWSDAQDDWFQILKVDGENVSALTREQMTAGLFPADGHPITLTVKPHSGPVRRMPCFATESGDSKAQ